MEKMNADNRENVIEINGYYKKSHGSAFQNYQVGREDYKDQKPRIEGDLIQFVLDVKGSYDLVSAGGVEMETKMLSYQLKNCELSCLTIDNIIYIFTKIFFMIFCISLIE